MGDVTQALSLDPENVEALAERGLLRAAQGDKAGARKDFLAVLETRAGKRSGGRARGWRSKSSK